MNPKAAGAAAAPPACTAHAAPTAPKAQAPKRPLDAGTRDPSMQVDAEDGAAPKDSSQAIASTQMDTEEGDSQDKSGTAAHTRARTRSPVDVSWREIDAGGDGACGFNSVAVAYGLRQGEDEATLLSKAASRGKPLRQQVHQRITEHKNEASDGWILDPRATETTEGGSLPTDFDTWHDNILRPNRWICQYTLRAAAWRLGVRIVVVRHDGSTWEEPLAVERAGRSSSPLVLALRDNHYTVLVPKARRELPGWVDCVPQGALSDHLRGGGKRASARSQAAESAAAKLPPLELSDSEAWLPPQSVVHTGRPQPSKVASAASWLPTSVFCTGSEDTQGFRHRQHSASHCTASAHEGSTYTVETPNWYCEECKEHVRPASGCNDLGRGLSQARTAHIARRHPGRPSSEFPRIREVATVAAMHQRQLKGGPAGVQAGSNLQAWAQELDRSHASPGAQTIDAGV